MTMNDSFNTPLSNTTLSSTISSEILLRKILLGSLLFSLAIFTIFGNLLVLHALRTEKRLRTVSNLFILSLALADLIVGLIVMPLSAANIIAGRWPFSYLICQMWLSIDYVASTASILNLVLLSLDRYWAVVHPLLYLRNRTRKRATNFIVIVWFLSLLWAPAIIFWPSIAPQYSDQIKPNECDTAFRSNKTFKTLTALGNFYFPLLLMILISCRIMVAIRSRSTMEFGRRISSATQRQMKQDRLQTRSASIREQREATLPPILNVISTDECQSDTKAISTCVNPLESIIDRENIPESQSDDTTELSFQVQQSNNDDNDSLWQYESKRSRSTTHRRFPFSPLKPITILFPSLSAIKEHDKRLSDEGPKAVPEDIVIRNSLSVSNDMKLVDRQSNKSLVQLSRKSRTLSTSSFLCDEYPQTLFINPFDKKKASRKENHIIITPPGSPPVPSTSSNARTNASTDNIHLCPPSPAIIDTITPTTKVNILTFFDYIINPSLSSSLQKELKAARQLGMLVGVFTVSWLPYFILFLVVAWCHTCVSDSVYSASIWLGYLNSTVNPLIYPLCNTHFRRAFKKTFYCQHAKTKLPNFNTLRELRTLNSTHQRQCH